MRERDTGLYMESNTLGNFARNTAAAAETLGNIGGRRVGRDVHRSLKNIKAIALGLSGATVAEEWLNDNWYIAQREGKEAAERFFEVGKLPKIGGSRKRAAVSDAAYALVRAGRGEITLERIRLFLEEYQHIRPMYEKELNLFIAAIKAELIHFLEIVCFIMRETPNDDDLPLLMKNIFTSLRTLSVMDTSELMEEVNPIERVLRKDPAGIYPIMDEDTRFSYRQETAILAKKDGISESDAAERILKLAENGEEKHVGYYIFTKPMGREKREKTGDIYISTIIVFSLFLTVLASFLLEAPIVAILLIFPISEVVKNFIDFLIMRFVRPKLLPKMELKNGIPASGKTICVISALISNERATEKYLRLLEEYYLANRDAGENMLYGVLADLPEAKTQNAEGDAACIKKAADITEKLNKKYGERFYFLLRQREYSKSDGIYMAKERKRGAILELTRFITGEKSTLECIAGDGKNIKGTNFIITLDSDTRLTPGSAKELVGSALHPLNVPAVDAALGRVVRGHGIIQPRVSVCLNAANKSDFTRIFAGQGGIDPYGGAVSDVYQDLFGHGSFVGKGIINVQAYAACLDKAFPDNTVLSHDLIEGAYLGCAFMGNVELTDGYPYKVASYFSRMHRWTRGDWQNIRWLGKHVKNSQGETVKNPISDLDKFKVFDNLRRSLVSVFTLAAILIGLIFSTRDLIIAAVIAVLAEISGFLISSAALLLRHDGSTRLRYHSQIIPGFTGAFMQTLIRLMLLPVEAWTNISAIVTALYRMLISHKNMLKWVTASDAERKAGDSVKANYISLLACPLVGLAILPFSPLSAAIGLVWIFTPAYAYALSRELHTQSGIDSADRSYLITCAADIWKYFDDLLREEDNWLPPDNFQEQPAAGVAHRTSPTNIGLAMLSVQSAYDLGLVSLEPACNIIEKMISSIEKLEKWRGHLYNWYDTKTAKPMLPRCVSTVDSGNLAGCLIVMKSALRELRRDELADRCEALAEEMDFVPLFDEKRLLFYIGWDIEKDEPYDGWYDLLASEARQTSFIAIATGAVPRKHWKKLGRALVSVDNYSGMASWTGTMFEYLMPNLILPCPKNSLLYESTRFCIYAQKHAHSGIPWGISESAFYAFDPGLSYRYKAHGVQRLALKRGMGTEIVISPYSTFLALPFDHNGAIKNLKRLGKMGMHGKYGFYEAADFTPIRQTDDKYEIVRTFMVHHLGMSLVAIANTLTNDIMPKRFMNDRRMAAFEDLLEERVPTGEVTLKQMKRDVPEKIRRQENTAYIETITGIDAIRPHFLPLSNGEYSVLIAETGHTRSKWRNYSMTRFEPMADGRCGMEMYLKTPAGVISLLPAPEYDRSVEYSVKFSDSYGKIVAKAKGFVSGITISVPPEGAGEIRTVDIGYLGTDVPELELICAFEPVLQNERDFISHPAFSKLSLEAEQVDGALVIHRRGRGNERDMYLCFLADSETEFKDDASRGVFPESETFKATSPEMRVSCAIKADLKNGKARIAFALSPADNFDEALLAAKRMLVKNNIQAVSRLGASAIMLSMDSLGVKKALSLIPELVFNTNLAVNNRRPVAKRESLWRFGISGDIPVLAAVINDRSEIEKALELLRQHALLYENDIKADLVLLLTDGGDYRGTQKRAITETLRSLGRDGFIDASGGVHILEATAEGAQDVLAAVDCVASLSENAVAPKHLSRMPIAKNKYRKLNDGILEYRFEDDGSFVAAMRGKLPNVAWSSILANGEFGYVATDAGTGHMWYKNARELKINRWLNDPHTVEGTEQLKLLHDGERISLFSDGDGRECLLEYGFGFAKWEKNINGAAAKVTAFVPPDVPARIMIVELSGDIAGDEILWFTDLTLGAENKVENRANVTFKNGVLCAENSPDGIGAAFYMISSKEPYRFGSDRNQYLLGNMIPADAFSASCMTAAIKAEKEIVIVTGCGDRDKLRELANSAAAHRLLEETKRHWQNTVRPLTVETPDKELNNYINGWALYQTICCRITARTALYQNGGAYGFRDQLQDVCSIIDFIPQMAENHIITAAAHQYEQGDVQHWWHQMPGGDKGVRTRCSDDLIWLPYVLCKYVEITGCEDICYKQAPYLQSEPLKNDEDDRYETPVVSKETDSILHHAMRASDEFIRRGKGEHGLALILGGDWNDGMNTVGAEGKGESVWLSWFGSIVLTKLSRLLKRLGQEGYEKYEAFADGLRRAACSAWDGEWYKRGYYDNGKPLGSRESSECKIDSIAQSFAVFAGADREKCKTALRSAYEHLLDKDNRVCRLFYPGFDVGEDNPGYIKSYALGYRENGGQYTHGAVWLAMAMLEVGMTEEAYEILHILLAQGRDNDVYKAEPYVLAADVYSADGHKGRSGWTWYTGAAGWYWRTATEKLLGIKVSEGRLYVEPRIPKSWDGFSAKVNVDGQIMNIVVDKGPERVITVNGEPYNNRGYALNIHNKFVSTGGNM